MGVTSAALVLACVALVAYDNSTARTTLALEIGMLADVVGGTTNAAVSFGDAKGATETLNAVAVNKNVRLAAIVRDGAVFARFDRRPETTGISIESHVTADLLRAPRAVFTFDADSLRVVRPIRLDGEVIGGVYLESDLAGLADRRRRLFSIIALVLSGALAVAFVLSSGMQRLISGPILRLTAAAQIVSRDKNYDIRVKKAGGDEVGVLIDGFNEMLTEIQRRDRRLLDQQGALEHEVDVRTTDLRQANVELLTARDKAMDSSRAKSEFLANMSHEIRTPMNGVIGMTELVLDSTLTVAQRGCLEMVKSSAASLLGLLNDILDFSKLESLRLALETIQFPVVKLVEDTLLPLGLIAHQKGLELIADIGADVPAGVVGDPSRLGQIITNLVGNAIKFTAHGQVLLEVRCDERWPDRVRLRFSVSDSGIGIPADKHATIFEAFSQADGSTTRRFGGTGLGLTISATLVHLMQGRIWVDSQPGAGSTFQFTIVCPTADLETRVFDHELADVPVLIVDDNEASRRVFADLLTRWQMKVTAVDGGRAALSALAAAATAGCPFALVLLDASMPEMDGFAVAEHIAADPELRATPIMMLTSTGQFGDSTRCRELGIDTWVTKPIRQADLFDALDQARQNGRPRRPVVPPVDVRTDPVERAHILLAEDNLVNQHVAVGLLTRRGHTVDVVANGLEAVAATALIAYDLVLMDVQMPEMGGIEATAAIRKREGSTGPRLRIVALTAHAMTGDRERYLAAGMDDYLSKPIDSVRLFAAVERQPPTAARIRSGEGPAPAPPFAAQEMRHRLGSPELIDEVTRLFLDDIPARLAEIKSAVAARDRDAIGSASHSLKGAAGSLSAAPVAEQAAALEAMAADGPFDPVAAEDAYGRLEAESARLVAVLRASLVNPVEDGPL
ncbi:MAG: response regulator [Acidobacteriota bacterium]